MDNARWEEVAALFDELVELVPSERARRLAELAHSDPALAAEVESLLAADDTGSDLLDRGSAAALIPGVRERDTDGATADGMAGPYRLLRPLGEGGMGVVWLAERTDGAYEQQVAVKLLKRGMDTHAILRRFLQERRILARLHHAHIVRLVDGGMSADGRPFYVMDHVDGQPITAFAASRALDVRARVELLATVAEAVAYAHSQLIVHRDLKPSNVLVDASGEPRVLDFGIAKIIEESGEQTLTGTGLRVLSPAYAAPEQILGEPIGTATDVYALGLMLCELLVGELPQRRTGRPEQLARDATLDVADRASSLAGRIQPERVAALYGGELDRRRLGREIAGDLDLIIANALRRDPARRYATALMFAGDLRNWLARRPITARADSAAYRTGRFVRRHRIGVAATVLIAMSLVGGLGAAVWQARIARDAAQRADTERALAERQLARTERVKDFILTLFREQDPISRANVQARSPAELIQAGIAQTDASFAALPDLHAELLRDLGEIQVNLGDIQGGEATLARAWTLHSDLVDADPVATAETLAAYGEAVFATGDVKRAASMLREAIAHLERMPGPPRARTAQAEAALASIELVEGDYVEAERLARHAIAVFRTVHGDDDARVASHYAMLGKIQQESTRYAEALETYREALAIIARTGGEEHVRTALLRTYIGDVLRVQREYDEALVHYEAALRIERANLPAGHSIIGGTMIRLGDLQRRTGRLDLADRSFTEAIAILEKTRSGNYAQALQFHANLARAQGEFELAERRYAESFEVFRAVTGDSPYTWLTALERVSMLTELGRYAEADTLGREASDWIARIADADSYDSMYAASVIGELRNAEGRAADAVPLLRHALGIAIASYGEAHAEVAQVRVELASSLLAERSAAAIEEAGRLIEAARVALEQGGDAGSDPFLGATYLARSRWHRERGDLVRARADIPHAIRLLQSPEHVRKLREARVIARELGVRT